MFGWWKVKEKKPDTPAEVKLKQIADILFPPLQTQMTPEGHKYQVDYSADSNLDAALIDLEDGTNDRITQSTVRKVSNKLFEVRKLLEAYSEIDPEAQYLLVDDETDDPTEHINSAESPGC